MPNPKNPIGDRAAPRNEKNMLSGGLKGAPHAPNVERGELTETW